MKSISALFASLLCFILMITAINTDPVRPQMYLPRRFTFVAHIHIKTDENKVKTCLGSLIADRWIVTAAHCVVNRQADDIQIHFGDIRIHMESNVSSVITHPYFNAEKYEDDIALLKLSTKVRNKYLSLSPIPTLLSLNNTTVQLQPVYSPKLIGWHLNTTSSTRPVVIVSHSIATNRSVCRNTKVKNVICTQTENHNEPMVRGDSGSPLLGLLYIKSEKTYQYIQIGVLSYLKKVTHYRKGKYTNYYFKKVLSEDIGYVSTNLLYYIDWIEDIINNQIDIDDALREEVAKQKTSIV